MQRLDARLAVAAVVAIVAVAGIARVGGGPSGVDPTNSPEDVASTTDVGFGLAVTETKDGVSLTLSLDRRVVEPGGSVTFAATLRNHRDQVLTHDWTECGFTLLDINLPVPLDQPGRTWTGRADWFKRFVLANATGPGGVLGTEPQLQSRYASPCINLRRDQMRLAPGESRTSTFPWTAELVPGLPAPAGEIAVEVRAEFDPVGDRPRVGPSYTRVSVAGELVVEGAAPQIVSAGEAIDRLLEVERFVTWLERQPEGTCDSANLILQHGGGRIPLGPGWIITLYCEHGVPRHLASAVVDAITGEVRLLDICDDPCDK